MVSLVYSLKDLILHRDCKFWYCSWYNAFLSRGTISGAFVPGELITGAGGATAYVINAQSEPKVLYIIPASGTFQSGEVVTGGSI